MARAFDDASTQYLEVQSTPVTEPPFTLACWFFVDNVTSGHAFFSIGDKDAADQYHVLRVRGDLADRLEALSYDGSAGNANTNGAYTANTWHHACGVFTATNDRAIFADGGNKATNSSSVTPANIDSVAIGVTANSGRTYYHSGNVAEAAIWNVALTDAEVAVLAKGYSPLFVRPESLVAYWPLIRDTDNDVVGGYNMTPVNGPTVAVHPPVLYPVSPHSVYFATAGETTYSFIAAGYAALKETASKTAALYAVLKETASNTAAGQAIIRMVTSATAAGQAVLKETASITAAGYSVFKETVSQTAAGQAVIKMATSTTAALQATLKEAYSVTAAGYSVLKETASNTAAGQAVIKMATSTTAALQATLREVYGVTAAGQAVIKMSTSTTAALYSWLRDIGATSIVRNLYAVLKETASNTAAGQAVIRMVTSATSSLFGFLQDRTSATMAMLSTFYERQAATTAMHCYLAGGVAAVADMEAQPRPFTLTAQERITTLEAPPRPFTLTAEDRRG